MGNGDMIANMGISIVVLTIVIFIFFVIVYTGVYLTKRYALSEKV